MSVPQNKPLRVLLWCAVSSEEQAADEKASLTEQERQLREIFEQPGYEIVDVLIVPGFSRNYYNFPEFAAAARREGIDIGDRLLEHLYRRDFDVFACRDGSRFGRKQSIFGEVVVRIIDAGARLYTVSDKWIDQNNYHMFISMAGYAAASYVTQLKQLARIGKEKRVSRGLPANHRHSMSHRIVRDEYGRGIKFIPDESKRRMFEDAAALLLEGVGYRNIEQQLFERFGHADKDGKPYKRYAIFHTLWDPQFWGHSARNHKNVFKPNGQKVGLWVFDLAEPMPDGALMWRNTHEPMLTGDLADAVQAEMRRRSLVIKGKARPYRTHKFTGLLICAYCGCYMVYNRNKGLGSYRYHSKYWARNGRGCPKTRTMSERKVQAWVNEQLEFMWQQNESDLLARPNQEFEGINRMNTLRTEIADLEEQIRRLIIKQAVAPENLLSMYDDQIRAFGEQLRILKDNLMRAEREAALVDMGAVQRAYDYLSRYETLENFWNQPETVINQLLHRLIGRSRLVVKDSQIIGRADAP